jgi:hypothetical protein
VSTSAFSADRTIREAEYPVDLRQVRAAISQGAQAANDGINLMQEVLDRIEQAQILAAATVHDSSHSEVEDGQRKLKKALEEAPRVAGQLFSGSAAAQEYVARL